MLKKNNIEYSLKDLDIKYSDLLSEDILKAVKYRIICFKNKNMEIATITIKISPIKGVSLYSTKCALFKYFLKNV